MTADRLILHFHEIAEAPDAVARLRRFLLDLAVRGELVEQDPAAEPAYKFLSDVVVGTLFTEEREPETGDHKSSLDWRLPPSWCQIELQHLGNWAVGSGFPKNEQGNFEGMYPFVKVSDMNLPGNEKYINYALNYVDPTSLKRIKAKVHPTGTIVFPKIGGAIATNKRRILARPCCIDNNCLGFTLDKRLDQDFFYLIFLSMDFSEYQVGTAVPALQQSALGRIPIGVPPLHEQHRIVVKVDELMALCDELEAAQTKREHRRDRLVAATLHRLSNGHPAPATEAAATATTGNVSTFTKAAAAGAGAGAGAVEAYSAEPHYATVGNSAAATAGRRPASGQPAPQASMEPPQEATPSESPSAESSSPNRPTASPSVVAPAFYLRHLAKLTTKPQHIKQLRQTILNLAVQGKLVPQDPNDEPARKLLEDVSRRRLSILCSGYPNRKEAESQLRKQQQQGVGLSLPPIPSGWIWCTLMQSALLVVDCHNKTAPYRNTGIPLLRTSNIRDGRILWSDLKYVSEMTFERWSARCVPTGGDLLITREAPMGEAAIIPSGRQVCMGQRMMLARFVSNTIDPEYLLYTVREPNFMDRVQDKPVGSTVQHLRVGGVETMLIPLPPLAEQHRIVAKVDALMALCDELESAISQATTTRTSLLESILQEALLAGEHQ